MRAAQPVREKNSADKIVACMFLRNTRLSGM